MNWWKRDRRKETVVPTSSSGDVASLEKKLSLADGGRTSPRFDSLKKKKEREMLAK
jgi:hypothetical protein